MEIGSQEWLEFRRSHIMASDMPIIMGKSKWRSVQQLYYDKVEGNEIPDNPRMKRGRALEPKALAYLSGFLGLNFQPKMVLSKELEWAGATLDGLAEDGSICEIKCPGFKDHNLAMQEKVPEHYFHQLQWQMFVNGNLACWYVSYNPDAIEDFVYFKVRRDEEAIREMKIKGREFYELLTRKTPPKADYTVLPDSIESLEKVYVGLKEEEALIASRIQEVREKLISCCDGKKGKGKFLTLNPVNTKGLIDYKLIPELASVDVEKYRKPSTIRWTIVST